MQFKYPKTLFKLVKFSFHCETSIGCTDIHSSSVLWPTIDGEKRTTKGLTPQQRNTYSVTSIL